MIGLIFHTSLVTIDDFSVSLRHFIIELIGLINVRQQTISCLPFGKKACIIIYVNPLSFVYLIAINRYLFDICYRFFTENKNGK